MGPDTSILKLRSKLEAWAFQCLDRDVWAVSELRNN